MDDLLRVLHLCPSAQIGGAERIVLNLARPLRDRGVETHVAVLGENGPFVEALGPAGAYGFALGSTPPGLRLLALRRYCVRAGIHVLQLQGHRANWLGRPLAKMLRGVAVITVIHGVHGWQSRVIRWVDRLSLPLTDCFISVSRRGAAVAAEVGIDPALVRVIPNPVPIEGRAVVSDADQREARASLELPSGEYVLLFLGNLRSVKQPTLAVDALSQLREWGIPAHLLMVGRDEMDGAVQDHVTRSGISRFVRFFGYRADVHRFIAAADVAVLSSLSEGVPMALLEAMAAGRAVVATDVGGVGEIVTDGVSGLLVAPTDPQSLAEALQRLWTDPGLRERMRFAARAAVETNHSVELVASMYRKVYCNARLVAEG